MFWLHLAVYQRPGLAEQDFGDSLVVVEFLLLEGLKLLDDLRGIVECLPKFGAVTELMVRRCDDDEVRGVCKILGAAVPAMRVSDGDARERPIS